ncbi:hypothetical protein AKJ16_DCAP24812 [Drosera capensis]
MATTKFSSVVSVVGLTPQQCPKAVKLAGTPVFVPRDSPCRALAIAGRRSSEFATWLSVEEHSRTESTFKMESLVAFLYEDIPRVFSDRGLDHTVYDDQVKFRDPITKYDCLSGYLFNIAFLKNLFNPDLQLHWVKQTGPCEITARWAMVAQYALLPWKPELIITGTSVMEVNRVTRKIFNHVDYWDSIQCNEYFSVEGMLDIIKQARSVSTSIELCLLFTLFAIKYQLDDFLAMQLITITTPDMKTPEYQILKRAADYEVRKYSPCVAADAEEYKPSGSAGCSTITWYTVGENTAMQEIPMTKVKGGFAAVLKFSGKSTDDIVDEKEKELRASLLRDGLVPQKGCLLTRYSNSALQWDFIKLMKDGFAFQARAIQKLKIDRRMENS